MNRKLPHALTITCHAENTKSLFGSIRETLSALEREAEGGTLSFSGVMEGGGPQSIVHGFYAHPSDLDFAAHQVDSPELPPVELSDEFAAAMEEVKNAEDPPAVMDLVINKLKEMFPGVPIEIVSIQPDEPKN